MRGYLKGIVTGGIIGAIVGAFLISNKESAVKSNERTRRIKTKVNELMRR